MAAIIATRTLARLDTLISSKVRIVSIELSTSKPEFPYLASNCKSRIGLTSSGCKANQRPGPKDRNEEMALKRALSYFSIDTLIAIIAKAEPEVGMRVSDPAMKRMEVGWPTIRKIACPYQKLRTCRKARGLVSAADKFVKPSALHWSEPTPLWTMKSPSGSYFLLISTSRE